MIGITKCSLSAGLEPVVKPLHTNDAFFHLFLSHSYCLFSQPPGCFVCFVWPTCVNNVLNRLFHTDSVNASQSVRAICVLHVFLWTVPSSCDADSLSQLLSPYWWCSCNLFCAVNQIKLSMESQYCADLYTLVDMNVLRIHWNDTHLWADRTAHSVWPSYCCLSIGLWFLLWLNDAPYTKCLKGE